jgi:3-hydroxy acid dehydrogenase/malonic semialdehyde reductase
MLSVRGKTVFISGASSGIGKATAELFAANGANVILAARRLDRLEKLKDSFIKAYDCNVLPLQLDIQNKSQVKSAIDNLPAEWKNIDILINNAGLSITSDKIQEGNVDNWDVIINTNLQGLLYLTRAILPVMIERKHGHIFNIGSTAAHDYYLTGNIYSATKHAVRALSKSMRIDLLGSGIRVSEIDPGMVHTEFSEVRWQDKKRADEFYQGFTPLAAEDIADAILYCATRPLHVDVAEMVIYPTDQASANHLYKQGGSGKIF